MTPESWERCPRCCCCCCCFLLLLLDRRSPFETIPQQSGRPRNTKCLRGEVGTYTLQCWYWISRRTDLALLLRPRPVASPLLSLPPYPMSARDHERPDRRASIDANRRRIGTPRGLEGSGRRVSYAAGRWVCSGTTAAQNRHFGWLLSHQSAPVRARREWYCRPSAPCVRRKCFGKAPKAEPLSILLDSLD